MPTPTPYQESRTTTRPAPCPTQPVAGRRVDTDTPVFDWTPVPGPPGYRVQIASSEAFDVIHYDETTDRGTAIALDPVLPDDLTTAFWRVREKGEDEEAPWSDPAHFAVPSAEPEDEEGIRVDAPPVPVHPDDRQEAPVDQGAVPFSWEEIPEASGYQLQVAPTEDFTEPAVDLTVDRTTTVTLYDVLSPEVTSYHWRVRPLFRVTDPGPWSDPVSFKVAPPPEDEQELAPESADPQAKARASGPVEHARTSTAFSLGVALLAVLSFIGTIVLIVLVS